MDVGVVIWVEAQKLTHDQACGGAPAVVLDGIFGVRALAHKAVVGVQVSLLESSVSCPPVPYCTVDRSSDTRAGERRETFVEEEECPIALPVGC